MCVEGKFKLIVEYLCNVRFVLHIDSMHNCVTVKTFAV